MTDQKEGYGYNLPDALTQLNNGDPSGEYHPSRTPLNERDYTGDPYDSGFVKKESRTRYTGYRPTQSDEYSDGSSATAVNASGTGYASDSDGSGLTHGKKPDLKKGTGFDLRDQEHYKSSGESISYSGKFNGLSLNEVRGDAEEVRRRNKLRQRFGNKRLNRNRLKDESIRKANISKQEKIIQNRSLTLEEVRGKRYDEVDWANEGWKNKRGKRRKFTSSSRLANLAEKVLGKVKLFSGGLMKAGSFGSNAVLGIAGASILGVTILSGALLQSNGNGGALTGNALAIYQYLSEREWGDIQIAAVLGNGFQESHLDPKAVQPNGVGHGIFQWSNSNAPYFTTGRWQQLSAYANSINKPWDSIDVQMDFFWLETVPSADRSGGYANLQWSASTYEQFMSASSVEEATTIFCVQWERCRQDENSSRLQSTRIPKALEFYELMQQGGDYEAGEAAGIAYNERMRWLFPEGTPTTESGMAPYLTTIRVPIINESGKETTMSLTCHRALANEIRAAFEDMVAVGFKVKASSTYCYGFRNMASGTGVLSHHSYGVAIDINSGDNPATYTGGHYDPAHNPYSIPQEVVEIWKAHGFYWGGDWSGYYQDYMHMTYTNH